MKFRFALAAAALIAVPAFADSVPLASQTGAGFYSVQLAGTGFNGTGEQVEVTVYDNTDDGAAFADITITDNTTSTTLLSATYNNSCLCFGVGSITDEADLTLAYGDDITITETAHEFSEAAVIYGSTTEAAAGYFNSSPDPTFTTELTITGAAPEPASLALFGSGLAGLVFAARRRRRT